MITRFKKSNRINRTDSVFGTAVILAEQQHEGGPYYTEISAIRERLEAQGLSLRGWHIRQLLHLQKKMGNLTDVGEGFLRWNFDVSTLKTIYKETEPA